MVLKVHDKWRMLAGGAASLTALAGAVLMILGGWRLAGCLAGALIAVVYGCAVYIYRKPDSGVIKELNSVSGPAGGGDAEPVRLQERER